MDKAFPASTCKNCVVDSASCSCVLKREEFWNSEPCYFEVQKNVLKLCEKYEERVQA